MDLAYGTLRPRMVEAVGRAIHGDAWRPPLASLFGMDDGTASAGTSRTGSLGTLASGAEAALVLRLVLAEMSVTSLSSCRLAPSRNTSRRTGTRRWMRRLGRLIGSLANTALRGRPRSSTLRGPGVGRCRQVRGAAGEVGSRLRCGHGVDRIRIGEPDAKDPLARSEKCAWSRLLVR